MLVISFDRLIIVVNDYAVKSLKKFLCVHVHVCYILELQTFNF